jgi:putative ribosome biogenesis GTPase RsgA
MILEGALAARVAGVPHLYLAHIEFQSNLPVYQRFPLDAASFARLMGDLSAGIIAVSGQVRDALCPPVPRERVTVVNNGLDVARYDAALALRDGSLRRSLGLREDSLIVVAAGRMTDDKGFDLLAEYEDVYRTAGYTTIITSALKGTGVDEVKASLRGRVTLIAGHSGVGKSTLVNAIEPDLDLPTEEISESSEKGQHTTTYAEMFELSLAASHGPRATGLDAEDKPAARGQEPEAPTFLIDTPGIKGFGLVDMSPEEIVDQFPEMFRLKGQCRFNNCMHQQEPGCAVRTAVENGEIAESRYLSYMDMVNGVEDVGPYRLD